MANRSPAVKPLLENMDITIIEIPIVASTCLQGSEIVENIILKNRYLGLVALWVY